MVIIDGKGQQDVRKRERQEHKDAKIMFAALDVLDRWKTIKPACKEDTRSLREICKTQELLGKTFYQFSGTIGIEQQEFNKYQIPGLSLAKL